MPMPLRMELVFWGGHGHVRGSRGVGLDVNVDVDVDANVVVDVKLGDCEVGIVTRRFELKLGLGVVNGDFVVNVEVDGKGGFTVLGPRFGDTAKESVLLVHDAPVCAGASTDGKLGDVEPGDRAGRGWTCGGDIIVGHVSSTLSSTWSYAPKTESLGSRGLRLGDRGRRGLGMAWSVLFAAIVMDVDVAAEGEKGTSSSSPSSSL